MRAPECGRRGLVGVAGVAAGVLAFASVAMACIPYKGKMEVEGLAPGGTSTEVVGAGAGMAYCSEEPYGPSAELPNPGGAGTFRVRVKPNNRGDCAGAMTPSQLVGHYGVRFWSGSPTPLGTSSADYRCFSWNDGTDGNTPSVRVGDLIVDPLGYGEGDYAIPAGAAPGYGAVCVQNPFGPMGGNRAPILVL